MEKVWLRRKVKKKKRKVMRKRMMKMRKTLVTLLYMQFSVLDMPMAELQQIILVMG